MKGTAKLAVLLALLALIAAACTYTIEPRYQAAAAEIEIETIEVEVAENGYQRFSSDESPVFEEDGLPAYGNEFITQGYLYPPGTLTCDEQGICDGVLEDGTPEFPDAVLGEWTCWGYHIGDGAHTVTGPVLVTNQIFSFGAVPGAETITTSGYELADSHVPVARAITGGTGPYSMAAGEQVQEAIGFDMARGISLSVTLTVAKTPQK